MSQLSSKTSRATPGRSTSTTPASNEDCREPRRTGFASRSRRASLSLGRRHIDQTILMTNPLRSPGPAGDKDGSSARPGTALDNKPDASADDLNRAARINFRDYPSSTLVMLAALTSGVAWALYKWRGRKSAAQHAAPDGVAERKGPVAQVGIPGDEAPRAGTDRIAG